MTSRHKGFFQWILGTAFTVVAVLSAAWLLDGTFNSISASLYGSRSPASIPAAEPSLKSSILNSQPLPHMKPIRKPSGIVDVSISAPNQEGAVNGSFIHLEGTIEAQQDLESIRFAWLLPSSGVEVVNGPIEGDIISLKNGEQTTVRLNVRSYSDENQRIHLHVYKIVNGEPMGKMAQYNTVNQPHIEREMRAKSETLQEMRETGAASHKILQ